MSTRVSAAVARAPWNPAARRMWRTAGLRSEMNRVEDVIALVDGLGIVSSFHPFFHGDVVSWVADIMARLLVMIVLELRLQVESGPKR